jgi:phosphate starvation-inducible PhoH-like protein
VQEVLSVSNDVAAELATVGDGVLDALRERLRITLLLRGNRLTIEGDDPNVAQARAVVDELASLSRADTRSGPSTVDAVLPRSTRRRTSARSSRTSSGAPRQEDLAEDRSPESATSTRSEHTVTFAIGPAGTGKTYLAMALAVAALSTARSAASSSRGPAVEAGERLGFLPGDMLAKVDPYLRPALRRALRHARPDRLGGLHGEGHDRGRAARVHAWPAR